APAGTRRPRLREAIPTVGGATPRFEAFCPLARRLLYRLDVTTTPEDPMPIDPIQTIDRDALADVAGGTRVTSRGGSSDQLTTLLTDITNSIKDLAGNRNQSDPTQMLLLMMMMGGMGGGGGGGVIAGGAAAGPPVINVDTSVLGRGGYGGFGGPFGPGPGCCRPPCGSKKGW